jgi:hypothetical protein
MDMNKNLFMISVLVGLACVLATANAYQRESVLDRIEQSIPEREAGWKLIKNNAYLRTEVDNFPQAALFWTNGVEEVGAYIVVYRAFETAKGIFERDHKEEDVERRTKLEGIGEAAYMWVPEKENDGYVIRFSKANVVVMMSSRSEGTVKRCAKYVAESIPPPNKGMNRTRK